ncbi:MAG TPA: LamG-like jellyroll fold domain-containing protein, partial [Bacillota bacterium]|nr:LamG-like jellyroll fold domain-containing protein [Bacillota bacterium]
MKKGLNPKVRMALVLGSIVILAMMSYSLVSAAVIFSDDFNDGNASGWTVQYGTWSVVSDSGSYVYYKSGIDEGRSSAGNQSWTNYSVQARVKVDNFNGSNRAYVCGRYKDGNNYYCASLMSNTIEIRKKVSGSSSTLVSKSYTIATGTWYTVKLVLNGSSISMYIDGVQQLSTTDSSLTSGAIGLVPYKVTAKYDDIIVDDSSTGSSTPTPTLRTGTTPTPTRRGAVTATPTPTSRQGSTPT